MGSGRSEGAEGRGKAWETDVGVKGAKGQAEQGKLWEGGTGEGREGGIGSSWAIGCCCRDRLLRLLVPHAPLTMAQGTFPCPFPPRPPHPRTTFHSLPCAPTPHVVLSGQGCLSRWCTATTTTGCSSALSSWGATW